MKQKIKKVVKKEAKKQTCVAILKGGKNKGQICGCKVKFENLCGKHNK